MRIKNALKWICLLGLLLKPVIVPAQQTAIATSMVATGKVSRVTILNGGDGYVMTPSITFVGGGGHGAMASAIVSNGAVASIVVSKVGIGYTNAPAVVIEPP